MYTYVCMKIFYTASYFGKDKYQKYYDMILKQLKDLGVEIISPEKGNYKELLTKKELSTVKDPKQLHYLAIKKGIMWADAVVMEISNEDFQLGHEATIAVDHKKHTLCMSLHEDYSQKIKNRYFHAAKYNSFNYEELLETFVEKVKKELLNERFNMFLSPRQVAYLDKASKEYGINKSEYVRMLIDKDRRG